MKSTQPQHALAVSYGMLGEATVELVWAMQWLDTLSDRLTGDHMVAEFMAELNQRRTTSNLLNIAAGVAKI